VFASRNVAALAPIMTETAERATARLTNNQGASEIVKEMLSSTFDVICEVALSGREHFDAEVYGEAITRYFMTVGRASLLDFLVVRRECLMCSVAHSPTLHSIGAAVST